MRALFLLALVACSEADAQSSAAKYFTRCARPGRGRWGRECPSASVSADSAPTFRVATSSGVGMSAECADKAQLYTTGGLPVYATRYSASPEYISDKLWDGGTVWDGGPGATECVATCTKGDYWHPEPGSMVCMSPGAVRVMRGGDGSDSTLGVMAEGSYRGNALGDTQAFETFSSDSSGVAVPTVTANVAKDPYGAMTAERIQFPAVTAGQHSRIFSFHGCQNAGGDTVASVYFANFDGGTTATYPTIGYLSEPGVIIAATCLGNMAGTGAGDGGLRYSRCFTSDVRNGLVNGSWYFGAFSLDGGSSPAMDLAVFGGQCENTASFVGSYIPNSAHNDQSGNPYPSTVRGVDVIVVYLDAGLFPPGDLREVSMSTDVYAAGTHSFTSEVFQSLGNGSQDFYFQLQSGFNNNTPDRSMSFSTHARPTARMGLHPTELLWWNWNHMRGSYSTDSGVLFAKLNSTADAGFFAGHVDGMGFLPLQEGFLPVNTAGQDSAIWNLCGDYSATHSAFGVCKNICLSLSSTTACQ